MDDWNPEADRRRLESVHVGAFEIRAGDRVRLRPRGRADILDLALAGEAATVEVIEQDFEGKVYLAVTVLYVISAFTINRIMAVIEKRSRVPGFIVSPDAAGGGH